jgi:hypothetical protein
MTLAWQPSSVRATPKPGRRQLPWIAWGLIAAWSLIAVAVALYGVLSVTLDGRVAGGATHFGLQARAGLDLLLFVVWFMSFNLALAGLVIGVLSTARRATGRLWRSATFATLVVLGGIAEVWGLTGGDGRDVGTLSYVRDVRLHSVLTCVVALIVVGGAAALLGLRRDGDR